MVGWHGEDINSHESQRRYTSTQFMVRPSQKPNRFVSIGFKRSHVLEITKKITNWWDYNTLCSIHCASIVVYHCVSAVEFPIIHTHGHCGLVVVATT